MDFSVLYIIIPIALAGLVYYLSKRNDKIDHDLINHIATKTAVQFAVLKFIKDSDENKEFVKEIIINTIGRIENNQLTSIKEIHETILKAIPWDRLDDAEKMIIRNLIELLISILLKEHEKHFILDEKHTIDAKEILSWVYEIVE